MSEKSDDNQEDGRHEDIRAFLNQPVPPFNPDQSLRRVLTQARRQTTARDIVSFFFSWLWLLFAGFGASMYGAGHKLQQQKVTAQRVQARRRPRPQPDQP